VRIQLIDSRREDGAVAVIVAIFTVVLLGIVAFTTDFGMAYAQRQALATGADSAALAVIHAEKVSQLANPTRTCSTAIASDAASDSTIALAQVNANAPFNAAIPASAITTTLSCPYGLLQATVVDNRTINTIFGGVLGRSTIGISRQAVAVMGVVDTVSGLSPFAVCTNQAQAIIAKHLLDVAASKPDSAQLVSITKVWGSGTCDGGGGSGNWGWLDFGQGKGDSALGGELTTGDTFGPLTLDTSTTPPSYSISGTPGNKGNGKPVVDGMQTIMDNTITIPVYSTVTGNGANAQYTVIGFMTLQMCGYMANSKSALGKCYDSTTPGVQLAGDDMQIRYLSYTAAGQVGTACAIGSTCAFNSYVTKLVG
jgi:Flp pilus assembly protein TadG